VPGSHSFLKRKSVTSSTLPTLFSPSAQPPSAPPVLPNSSAPSPAHTIIPNIDQERAIDQEDDNDEDGPMEGSGDGLGDEDDAGDDEDGEDDKEDVEEDEDQSKTRQKARKARPLPSWLLEPFRIHVEQSGAAHRDANGLPPLYSRHSTFYFPQPAVFFLLANHTTPSPQTLYNPRFFLWDPLALCKLIPCPKCRCPLNRHNVIPTPRRVVDFDSPIWIIGYRYRCHHCLHPKSGKNTVTFRSWDPRILNNLPPALATEFPAMLSHRSGMAKGVFSFMRLCFQNGMGAKQFSDALRVQHLLSYDNLHLQYLDFIAARHLDRWTGQQYAAFLPFDDISLLGPRAFLPSAQWLRDRYDDFIEEHRLELNQQMALLTAEVCAIDHSHKV